MTVRVLTIAAALLICLTSAARVTAQEEEAVTHPWNVSLSGGSIQFEGDEAVDMSAVIEAHVGYDLCDQLTVEGILSLIPHLNENYRTEWSTGERVSRLRENAGVSHTTAVGAAVEGQYHFSRWERFDPYLAAGAGLTWHEDKFDDSKVDPSVRAGAGALYHLNDAWALRADGRCLMAGRDTEFNALFTAGIMWTVGAGKPIEAAAPAAKADQDSDSDGLLDSQEEKLGTSPFERDTDKDGLTDKEEVEQYKTDPLNPDSDWDGLKDGAEVKTQMTNPLKRDTDGGKVADGHEVIEDKTNPKDKSDDLRFFELRFQFEKGGAEIKEEYISDLAVIGKLLKQNPGATARIEGHTDQTPERPKRVAKNLTQKRANAVAQHLRQQWKIESKRLKAVGYGFDRPKAKDDPTKADPENQRLEIYIRMPPKQEEMKPENK